MEPYDLTVHQLTFNEDQIQEDSLDSFSNVVHYDSALIDQKTGRKPSTQQVSQSKQFAWSSPSYLQKEFLSQAPLSPASLENSTNPSTASSASIDCLANQSTASIGTQNSANQSTDSIDRSTNQKAASPAPQSPFLPTPFQSTSTPPSPHPALNTFAPNHTKGEYAQQFDRLIKDVYSEVAVPFTPFTDQKTIPDWIFLHRTQSNNQDDRTFSRQQPNHIIAQPSKVKVTHVYNQSVWSQVPCTADNSSHSYIVKPGHNPLPNIQSTVIQPQGQTTVTSASDVTTLQQISANTSALRHFEKNHTGRHPAHKMASKDNHQQEAPASQQPFESVAEALHLQQSVIGNRVNVTPVSADVVAQIVADAQRKMQLGTTPVPTDIPGLQAGESTASTEQPVRDSNPQPSASAGFATQPPAPELSATATTRELIRIHGLDVSRTSNGVGVPKNASSGVHTHRPAVPGAPSATGAQSYNSNSLASNKAENVPQLPTSAEHSVDDNLSVASSNSELESFNENATENFLRSLPAFRHVNIADIMPEHVSQRPDMRFSPPVKETSFRPVHLKTDSKPVAMETPDQSYPPLVADIPLLSPDTTILTSPVRTQLQKSSYVIPKPGPLFHSSPRSTFNSSDRLMAALASGLPSPNTSVDNSTQYEELRKEKAKLEGQLEILSIESQATLQERAELQAQVASLKLKILGQKAPKSDAEKEVLRSDLESLKQLRLKLEGSLSELQRQLEEKAEEGRNMQDELNQSQDQCDRLNLKMKEIRDEVKTKEMTVQALKNKVAELYVEVQSSLHVKLEADNETRAARSELVTLQSTRDWYQQQLEQATRARSELQKELTLLQAQASSQSSIIERLKMENARLRQQFSDIQNKALKEKEMLAKHLEAIESDMMDREAAFQEIQRERSFLEDAFSSKIQTAEDEKSRIELLMQMTNDLENQLDKAHGDLKKKQNQIVQLENENIDLMKKLNLSQEEVIKRDMVVEDLKQNLVELESQLKAFQGSIAVKDEEMLRLKEEKAKTEIALNAALQEKNSVDNVLEGLKQDMGKVESSFKFMRQELSSKSVEVTRAKSDNQVSEEQMERMKSEVDGDRRMLELVKAELEKKGEQFTEVQGQRISLESEVVILKEKLGCMESSHEEAMRDKEVLDSELLATREKLEQVQVRMQAEMAVAMEQEQKQRSSVTIETEEYQKVQAECEKLKEKVTQVEKDSKKDLMKQKARSAKLNQDLNAVKSELMERQKTFDENIGVLSGKLREVAADKEKLETELMMTHRKYELSMVEQKDQVGEELQNLASELQQVKLEKQSLESHIVELQHARDSDFQHYQRELTELEEQVRLSQEAHKESRATQEINQDLALELEKEKGRLAGLMQSNGTLKQHVGQLETALASRESSLVDMQTQWQEASRGYEQDVHENLKRVQTLEATLQKEKDGQREIRKQIGMKISENKKLKWQNDGLKQDAESLRNDLATRVQEVELLQAELGTNKQEVLSRQAEMASLESENKTVRRELERIQQQLHDNMAREPVIQEQMKSLQWQLELKNKELQAAQEQLKLSEERQKTEINNMTSLLQEKTGEVDALKMDLACIKHEKQAQQAKISELRSALKSSIQHHKLTQKMSNLRAVNGSGDSAATDLPPLPFDIEDMDKLLQETTVRALESKPLDNLQNCLLNLRSEISGLQAQMDVHSNTVQTTNSSWNSIEQQVQELCTVVQTITYTTNQSSTTDSLAAAAVQMANNVFDI